MSLPTTQNIWLLANPPTGDVQPDTFSLTERPLPALSDGQLIIKTQFFSNDPAQRGWIQANPDPRSHAPPTHKNDPVRASGVAEVLVSKSSKWKAGDKVFGRWNWFDVGVISDAAVISPALTVPGLQAPSLSVFGIGALAAYHGIFDILKVQKEHVVVVSGAAGSVGSMAIQFAKHVVGAKRVIGIAGGKEKCDWVVNYLGADACVDYKAGNLEADLAAAIGDQLADRYFENVGGEALNIMFGLVKNHGMIGICGMISGYNGAKFDYNNIFSIIGKGITIRGFNVGESAPQWRAQGEKLQEFAKDGKIKTEGVETVVDASIQDVPKVWERLFSGSQGNKGKLITRLV